MAYGFLDTLSTQGVRAAQAANGSLEMWEDFSGHLEFDRFTAAEAAFVQARDSLYIATVSESGWPYIQHRGGPAGFLKVLDEKTLGFADFRDWPPRRASLSRPSEPLVITLRASERLS